MCITHLMPQALPPLTDLKFPLEHLRQHADVAEPFVAESSANLIRICKSAVMRGHVSGWKGGIM